MPIGQFWQHHFLPTHQPTIFWEQQQHVQPTTWDESRPRPIRHTNQSQRHRTARRTPSKVHTFAEQLVYKLNAIVTLCMSHGNESPLAMASQVPKTSLRNALFPLIDWTDRFARYTHRGYAATAIMQLAIEVQKLVRNSTATARTKRNRLDMAPSTSCLVMV